MQTPATIDNAQAAARCIQRAFRGMQRRIAADDRDLATMLNTLEEAEERRINSRGSIMHKVTTTLDGLVGSLASTFRRAASSGSRSTAARASSGGLPNLTAGSIDNLIRGLGRNDRVAMVDAIAILQAAAVLFMDEESVRDITVPEGGKCVVVGDLHGQLDDLLHILSAQGKPSSTNIYVFNGDLVDRGDHACETVLLVFALKLSNPNSVHVNRGNHEEPHINIYSGFEEECIGKYDHRVFQLFHAAFVWLPFACVINGKALVLHGGLPGDATATLQELREIARGPDVCSEEDNWGKEGWMMDILWSDPHDDPQFLGMMPSNRGAGKLWGQDVTVRFLTRENLAVLVRSHQCVPLGVAVAHGGHVYTVFSASNYCGTSGNMGAVLLFHHGSDRPNDTYQWDSASVSTVAHNVVSKRKGKEMRRAAAVHQAAEYIIENKAGLCEYYKLQDSNETGHVSFFHWAQGLAQVLQVRMAWNKLLPSLVSPEDMNPTCDGVQYERWLDHFSVELKAGCREWQSEVVGQMASAVLESGGDLLKAFEAMDTDCDGGISTEEFLSAVRKRLPSLDVLSDVQLEAVLGSFDADRSGTIEQQEFATLLNKHIAKSRGMDMHRGDSAPAVIGLQWDTRVVQDDGVSTQASVSGSEQQAMERVLADAIARLFYTHRRELFHIWHKYFDPAGTGVILANDFVRSVQVLDRAAEGGILSDEALTQLVGVLDTNGDGHIDFREFSSNIGRLVERVRGSR